MSGLNALEKVEIMQKALFYPAAKASFEMDGYLHKRIDRFMQIYFLETPESSLTILQLLRDRYRSTLRKPLMSWSASLQGNTRLVPN